MTTPDWNALERMRALFIEGAPVRGAYWESMSDLASYDATLGERIGWKWDALLGELGRLQWRPPSGRVVDFGCGSGVAGRRVVQAFGAGHFQELVLHDKSALAAEFASRRARECFPTLAVRMASTDDLVQQVEGATLVVSHVLGEMAPAARARLRALAARAGAVLWVEPGRHADSHALIEVREELRGALSVVAPCTHDAPCGLRAPGLERHWCHFFGKPPWEIFADPGWAEFAARMGVDLRSLPYSYLVLDRQKPGNRPGGCLRVIGEPRVCKGYARLFACDAGGVAELEWPKRSAGPLFKRVKDGEAGSLFRAHIQEGRILDLAEEPPRPEPEPAGDAPESGDVAQ